LPGWAVTGNAMLSLSVKIQESEKWVVSGAVKKHNHELGHVHCLDQTVWWD